MSRRSQQRLEPGALDLIESASELVRRAPAATLAIYLAGTVPFVLGFLFFWADMSRSPFAGRHLGAASLVLTIAYLWMELSHVLFCRRLLGVLLGAGLPPLNSSDAARMACLQAATQPLALMALIVASVPVLPLGWVFAFAQSLSVIGADPNLTIRELCRKARRQAELWPRQNHVIGLILGLFTMVVALNVAIALFGAPHLVKMLFGVESSFVAGGFAALNTTFLAAVFALTYLVSDPLIKATYVVRCFHGESLQSGADLRAGLRLRRVVAEKRVAVVSLLVAAILGGGLLPAPAAAAEIAAPAQVDPIALDRSIRETLERPEFAWRLPRKPDPDAERGLVDAMFEAIRKTTVATVRTVVGWAKAIIGWFGDLFPEPRPPREESGGRSTEWEFAARLLGYALLGLSAAVLGVALWRGRQRRRLVPNLTMGAVAPTPDLESEATTADQLPEEGWLDLARQLLARGELRLGVRALYLAALAHLSQRELVEVARFKSNRDYSRELARRAGDRSELLAAFAATVLVFERVWYGDHGVDQPVVARVERDLARIRAHA